MGMKLEVGKYYRDENGEKRGPMKEYGEDLFDLGVGMHGLWKYDGFDVWDDGKNNLIAEWTDAPTGPVRTVTRKEIKNGIYLDGALIVSDAGFGRLQFAICTTDPETFDKAMDMLRDIRDALEDS